MAILLFISINKHSSNIIYNTYNKCCESSTVKFNCGLHLLCRLGENRYLAILSDLIAIECCPLKRRNVSYLCLIG